MSTRTFDRHYVESSRVIEIVADDRDLWRPDPELESEPLVVATITSSGDVQGEQSPNVPFVRSHPWTPPSVRFERNDRTLTRYTRAQWEVLKREVDAAFNAFEATWPLAPAEPPLAERKDCPACGRPVSLDRRECLQDDCERFGKRWDAP